jgi:hypothetical protein
MEKLYLGFIVDKNDNQEVINRIEMPVAPKDWVRYNVGFTCKFERKHFHFANVVVNHGGYRLVKERWYHRLIDEIRIMKWKAKCQIERLFAKF